MNPEQVKEAKEKIVYFIQTKGPSLPVQIAREIGTNLIFTGAILSEMLSDRILKLSSLRVGGSHLYMIQGQEVMLEKFFTYLNRVEKDAYILLKENGILNDEKQQPAIRVALRSIKDFAIPFHFNDKLFWRYLSFSEENVRKRLEESPKVEHKHPEKIERVEQEIRITNPSEKKELLDNNPQIVTLPSPSKEQELGIFESPKVDKIKKPKIEFIEEIKQSLSNKSIEIINIEKSDKKEAIIKVKREKEFLIFAFNKKKISDKELIKAYKKSLSYSLPYVILIKEDASKKLKENIEASKALLAIEKL